MVCCREIELSPFIVFFVNVMIEDLWAIERLTRGKEERAASGFNCFSYY